MSVASAKIVLFPGDGVGPEVMAAAVAVLNAVGTRFAYTFSLEELQIGGAAYDAYQVPIRDEDLDRCRQADAALLGAVGGPAWDGVPRELRPEQGLLTLRKTLELFANLRPVSVFSSLVAASPIKADVVRDVDLLVVRELTGGIYFGQPSKQWVEAGERNAVDTLVYQEHEIERVVRLGFELAKQRKGRLASVDKANVLESSRLWRAIATEVAADYPDVVLEHVLVDAMAMHLIRNPARFDVIVTENMFGDILTDEASVIAGSIGLLPSASLGPVRESGAGARRFGLYEPIHGSAPDIAGQGRANPVGMILSVAAMLRMSLDLPGAAAAVEQAVSTTLAAGLRTPDVLTGPGTAIDTAGFGKAVADAVLAG